MTNQIFRANGQLSELTGNWLVQCLRCGSEIGTMTSETLRQAVFNNCNRGGVLCPDCRAASCLDCGDPFDMRMTIPEPRVCVVCALERAYNEPMTVCKHGFISGLVDIKGQLRLCLLCGIEAKPWMYVGKDVPCLSSISYLKPVSLKGVDKSKDGLPLPYVSELRVNEVFSEDDINICMGCGCLWRPRFVDRCGSCHSEVSQPLQLLPCCASEMGDGELETDGYEHEFYDDGDGLLEWENGGKWKAEHRQFDRSPHLCYDDEYLELRGEDE